MLKPICFLVLIFLYCPIVYYVFYIPIANDIDDQIATAQMSTTNLDETINALRTLRQNMKDRGIKEGYAGVFRKSEFTNVANIDRKVVLAIKYLNDAKSLDPKSDAYQQALSTARGTIVNLPKFAAGWFWARNWWKIFLVPIVLLIIAYFLDRKYFSEKKRLRIPRRYKR